MKNSINPRFILPSENLEKDLELLSYPGQNPLLRHFITGWEDILLTFPSFHGLNKPSEIDQAVKDYQRLIRALKKIILTDDRLDYIAENNTFRRTTIAMESPCIENDKWVGGLEIVIGQWGVGFHVPPHDHITGFMHEEIIEGTMKYQVYEEVEPGKIKMLSDVTMGPGIIGSKYYRKEDNFIHSFTILEPTTTIHVLPGRPRDGKGKQFTVINKL